jgi:hypothetical protein
MSATVGGISGISSIGRIVGLGMVLALAVACGGGEKVVYVTVTPAAQAGKASQNSGQTAAQSAATRQNERRTDEVGTAWVNHRWNFQDIQVPVEYGGRSEAARLEPAVNPSASADGKVYIAVSLNVKNSEMTLADKTSVGDKLLAADSDGTPCLTTLYGSQLTKAWQAAVVVFKCYYKPGGYTVTVSNQQGYSGRGSFNVPTPAKLQQTFTGY